MISSSITYSYWQPYQRISLIGRTLAKVEDEVSVNKSPDHIIYRRHSPCILVQGKTDVRECNASYNVYTHEARQSLYL